MTNQTNQSDQLTAARYTDFNQFQEMILSKLLNGFALVLLGNYSVGAFLTLQQNQITAFTLITLYLVANFVLIFGQGLPYTVRTIGLIVSLLLMSAVSTWYLGIFALGALLFTLALQTAIFFLSNLQQRIMLGLSFIVFVITIGVAAADTQNLIVTAALPGYSPQNLAVAETYLILNIMLILLFLGIKNQVINTIQNSTLAQYNLVTQQELMEKTIFDRTTQIEHQANLFETTLAVTTQISAITDKQELYEKTVELISDSFGFYHIGIFILDRRQDYAVLVASNGETGQQMVSTGHRLRKGQVGIVGHVTASGTAKISSATANDPIHYKNPLLPLTQSEAAFPLRSEGKVFGALDIQSTAPNVFAESITRALETIANQFSSTYQQIELATQLKKALSDQTYQLRQETARTWKKQPLPSLGYLYRAETDEIEKIHEPLNQESHAAENVIEIPIQRYGVTISVLRVAFTTAQVPLDIQKMLADAAYRISTALENARLLEELRYRAGREQLINDTTALIRSSTNVDQILKTAAVQLSSVIGAKETSIQLMDLNTVDFDYFSEEPE